MGKELDDICTSCPYIDAVKRHKQQLGAIEEYTQWLKKEPRASYFFLFQLYTRIHNTFFSQKQQLPFTPGGTHCPEPDVILRDLTLSPGYHSDYAPQPIPEMDSSAVVPPTNENTSPPEDTPDNTPAGGNTGQAEKTRNAGLTPIPEKRSGMPPEHLRFATGFPSQPKIAGPREKPMRTVHPDKIYREIICGFAPIFPDTCYHLTHYWPAAADIPVASDNPVHYAGAIRYNARTPLQGSLLPLTRLV